MRGGQQIAQALRCAVGMNAPGDLPAGFDAGFVKFVFERVKEEWTYQFLDVWHGSIVHTQAGTLFGRDDSLNH